ncbi:MAG: DUF4160 domain-containing protein [Gemmatimonadota bacterium]
MPVICRFLGIVVYMNYNDHDPPHFHARYQDQEVVVEIERGIVSGRMSVRALRLMLEWTMLHKTELLENWQLARQRKGLKAVRPLN